MTMKKQSVLGLVGVRAALCCLSGAALAACSDGGGEGTVEVRVYGEDFIEVGIPAEDMADGWEVSFSSFEVTVTDVTVGGVTLADGQTLDISAASGGIGHELTSGLVPTGNHDDSSFVITRVEIVGTAEKGEETRTFHWVLESPTQYDHCDTETRVTTDEQGVFQVTVHADHLFYDSLVSEEPELRFDALADADTSGDGEITEAELAAAGVGSYDVGNEDIDNLWDWLEAHARTLGHVDGEGHCDAVPVAP